MQVEASTMQVYLNVGDKGQKSYMMIGGGVVFVQFSVQAGFWIWAHIAQEWTISGPKFDHSSQKLHLL